MSIKDNVISYFRDTYNDDFKFIFSPGRINLIGEHTDYNEGFVFPAAIDKGIYAAIGRSSTSKSTIHALDCNESYEFSVNNVDEEPVEDWRKYIVGVVAEIRKFGRQVPNFNMVFSGDIPGGSGMSSSAALENSLVFGLNELFHLNISKEDMIFISQRAEHNYVGVKCGIMDQYASMFGQKGKALLLDCRTVTSEPFEIDLGDYELVLINTNVKHKLSDSAYNDRRRVCENVAKMLDVRALRDVNESDLVCVKSKISDEDYLKALYVVQENARVIQASEALKKNDLKTLGMLLFETHSGLRSQYRVSCNELDFLVDRAKSDSEVIGARMMGGGFGGCTINLIHQNSKDSFILETSKAYFKKFDHECSVYCVNLANGTHLENSFG